MLRARFGWMLVLSTALMMQSQLAFAQPPTVLGTWTGTAAQNEGKSNYTWRLVYRWSRDRGTRWYKFGLGLGRKLRRQSLRRLEQPGAEVSG